jgi:hypothetical protein
MSYDELVQYSIDHVDQTRTTETDRAPAATHRALKNWPVRRAPVAPIATPGPPAPPLDSPAGLAPIAPSGRLTAHRRRTERRVDTRSIPDHLTS